MMRVAFFSTHRFDRQFFDQVNTGRHQLNYFEAQMTAATAPLATDTPAGGGFVTDHLDAPVLKQLADGGTGLIALRSAGFNHVDLNAARELGLTVSRVPAYSPHAV